MSELAQRLAELLEASVQKCVEGQDVAIAFSGGIDCSLVAALSKKYANHVTLYTVGTRGSHDVEVASATAPLLGLEHVVINLDDSEIIDNLTDQIRITGTDSPLTLAFEMPNYCVMRNCRESLILGGQGADELFGGYNKYVGMKDLQMRDEMVKDLTKLITHTKPHEAALGQHFGKTVKYAYLDREIVALSRNAPTEALKPVDEDTRKMLLSEVAQILGYDFLVNRKKKAAQYGSGFMDAVRRVCKARGCTYNELVAELKRNIGN
ncbi:MAG: asparagine synthase-related protein [archaeon]|nr:asparagine synthase-related protein [archaeon]